MPRLADVAKVAGVSVATASRVLNRGKYVERISDACKIRVQAAAAQLGYAANYHAQVMKGGLAKTIAVAMEISGPAQDRTPEALTCHPYFMNLISGIEAATHKVGFALTLMGPTENELAVNRVTEGIREKRFDGGVFLGSVLTPDKTDLLTQAPDLPLVVVQPNVPTALPVVDFNSTKGVDLILDHLAQLGHREIAWLGQLNPLGKLTVREQYFVQKIWDTKSELRGTSLRFEYPPFEGTADPEQEIVLRAYQATKKVIAQGKPTFTALVCYNDITAIGCLRALLECNIRVPDDISVVGFDNTHAKFSYPALTTIDHKFAQMGLVAGKLLLEMIGQGKKSYGLFRNQQTTLVPELIVRQSTGCVQTSD